MTSEALVEWRILSWRKLGLEEAPLRPAWEVDRGRLQGRKAVNSFIGIRERNWEGSRVGPWREDVPWGVWGGWWVPRRCKGQRRSQDGRGVGPWILETRTQNCYSHHPRSSSPRRLHHSEDFLPLYCRQNRHFSVMMGPCQELTVVRVFGKWLHWWILLFIKCG